MKYILKRPLSFFLFILLLIGCKKKEFDEFYERPEGLADPIYKVLQSKGNFTNLLSIIDKAGYKNTLGQAGFWTLFAPNDSAFANDADFKTYLQQRNISTVSAMDSATAQSIVQYLLVYNAFKKDRIDDYQSNAGWVPDQAFRRRTAYYTGFYKDTTPTGDVVTAIQSNRNGSTSPYVSADNNNKYIPYFTDVYFNTKGLTASDYNYFYPASQFNGFNVAQAKVTSADIPAENGVIHQVDKVITPLFSIDQYLRSRPEYSEFKKLFDKYMASFVQNSDATSRFKLLTGKDDPVYVKAYNSLLAFSPNNENYTKIQDNDGQQSSWTLFAPKNEALLNYVNTVLLEHFKTFENAPPQVIADFLNAHMWVNPVWPSKFSSTYNFLGEEARFNSQSDVFDKKILSNGMFYGTNKVQQANVFSSVYGKAYLDPKYSIMIRLLDAELKFIVTSPNQKFTLFLMSDAAIKAAGYDYNSTSGAWSYTPPGGTITSGEAIRQRLLRILNTSVIPGELTSLSGTGIAEAYNNEYIRWNNNTVISIGSQDAGKTIKVDSTKTALNGKVYYLDGLLTFTDTAIGRHVIKLGGTSAATSNFYYFAQYLQNSASAYNSSSGASFGEINGTSAGTFYTVLVPSNAAIMQAVKNGVLPGDKITGIPNLNPSSDADKLLVDNFIKYHVVAKNALVPTEHKDATNFETLLKNTLGETITVSISTEANSMQIRDINGRVANMFYSQSNNLSNRAVIHLIDNYLKY